MSQRLLLLALSLTLHACGAQPGIPEASLDHEDDGVDQEAEDSGWDDPVAESPWWGDEPLGGDADDEDEVGWEPPFDPWSLNVVLAGDLGSSEAPYQSDFEGAAAVGGSAWMAWFSLNDVCAEPVPFALFSGGPVSITGAVNNGGVEGAGAISLAGASVGGPVTGGGDLLEGSGHIEGDLTLAGEKRAGAEVSVSGSTREHCPYSPVLDLEALADWFSEASAAVSGLSPTCGATERWGELTIAVSEGVNVVELEASALEQAWGVTIQGPEDAELYINVRDEFLILEGKVWTYEGGIDARTTLLNLPGAQRLDISQGDHRVNILAPAASVSFPSGLVSGNLVAASLSGGGQVNCGHFEGSVVP
jgi:choice-of-anchor A domain-containing protein